MVAALIVPAIGLGSSGTAVAAPGDPVVVFDSIGAAPGNGPSQAFQAQGTSELGDLVQLAAGPREVDSVTVEMVSYACQTGAWHDGSCVTTPGTSFSHPLTVNLYNVAGTAANPTAGSLIASVTRTIAVPYRPSAAGTVACPNWWSDPAVSGSCFAGLGFPATFDFPVGITLPDQVIWTVAFNTTTYGNSPIGPAPCGSNCGYDALNVLQGDATPVVGTNVEPDGVFAKNANSSWYCDLGVAGILRDDAGTADPNDCWQGAMPMARIAMIGDHVTTTVLGHTIGGENNTSAEWSYDHFEPKVPGSESVVTDALPTSAAAGLPSLLNGSAKLTTVGNESNGALSQQARVVHTFDPASAPTLTRLLYSRPQYSVYLDGAGSNPVNAQGAGNLQFGVQCGSWLGSVIMSPSDSGTLDVDGNLSGNNIWQTFRYPDPTDPSQQVFIATDAGTPPGGWGSYYHEISITELLDKCGNAKVVDARASQGRNSYPFVVSYLDNLTFLNHTYDFVTSIAPTITSGAPAGGVVGSPYTFTFTATGTPTPTITTVGTLPAGLTLNGAGVLSGTPTAAGTVSFIVNAANGVAPDDNDLVSVTISPFGVAPHITSGPPTAGVVGTVYSFPFTATGTPAPTFTSTGTLPTGLTLSAAGVLSGTPTVDGTFTFLVTASNGVSPNDSALVSVRIAPVVASAGPVLTVAATPVAVTPARLLDTRLTTTPTSGSTTNLKVAGLHGVPADAQAVFLNVTAVDSTGAGYVTVWAAGTTKPGTSNLNVERADQIIPNMVVTPVGAAGDVSIYVQTSTQIVVDVMGYIPAGVGYGAVTPQRALDTRATSRPGNGATTVVKVTDVVGTPAGATAVIMNVTAVQSSGAGYLTVWPTGQAQPSTSNLNVDHVGQTRPNMVIVPIGADGKVSVFQQTSADILVDIVGFFTPAANYNAIQPSQRVLDTRPPTQGYQGAKPGPNTAITVKVAGVGSVPADAKYVVVNLTADQATSAGYVTVYPGATSPPVASNLNMDGPGATASNLAFVPVGADGNIQLYTQGGTHLVLDVFGWVR